MKLIKTTTDLNQAIYALAELKRIAKTLHSLDEHYCNGFMSENYEKVAETRTKNLMTKAQEIAQRLGLYAYHQTDPRGCSLYLIEEGQEYTDGIAINSR